eukprot:sb/3469558/
MGTIPQGALIIKGAFAIHSEVAINILNRLYQVHFWCTFGVILVNLVLTVWTGILLNRKPDVATQRDQQRRNAAVTVVLLGVVFLTTNISGAVMWGLCMLDLAIDSYYVYEVAESILSVLMVVNAAINPLVILRKQLVSLCCSLQLKSIRSMFRNNKASAEVSGNFQGIAKTIPQVSGVSSRDVTSKPEIQNVSPVCLSVCNCSAKREDGSVVQEETRISQTHRCSTP